MMLQQRMRSVLSTVSLAALGICWATNAIAQQQETPRDKISGPGLFIFFEGDEPGKTIASTLAKLIDNQSLLRQAALPVKYHIIEPRDTVCKILYDQGYPLPCTSEIQEVVERINPKTSPIRRGLQLKDPLFLPDIHLEKYEVRRWVPSNTANDIAKNWKALNAEVSRQSDRRSFVQFDAYRIFVATESEAAAGRLLQLIAASTSPRNIKVDFVPAKSTAEKQHDGGPQGENGWRDWCEKSGLTNTVRYRDLSATADTAQSAPYAAQASVPVYVIDGPIHASPNLHGAVANASPPPLPIPLKCAWVDYSKPHHHATHMAGIIASRDNGSGLMGIAPLSKIHPFPWLKVEGATAVAASGTRVVDLQRLIEQNNDQPAPIPIYLIATEFPQPPPQGGETLDRFRSAVASSIRGSEGLFVVAAGQVDKDRPMPLPLSVDADISPQNLGDQENVIVVTACLGCTTKHPRIMQGANKSAAAQNPVGVQVAAPGGAVIGSWVAEGQFSAANGTSQAAAFVAGVAAQMIGRYREVYKTGLAVKKRLQATSFPANWDDNDTKKLSVGIVDPRVALLDPTKTWIKQNEKWSEIKIKPLLADDSFNFRDGENNTPEGLSAMALLRVARTVQSDVPADRRWDFYVDGNKIKSKVYERGQIIRIRKQVPSGALALCDNAPPMNWVDVQDLIIAVTGGGC